MTHFAFKLVRAHSVATTSQVGWMFAVAARGIIRMRQFPPRRPDDAGPAFGKRESGTLISEPTQPRPRPRGRVPSPTRCPVRSDSGPGEPSILSPAERPAAPTWPNQAPGREPTEHHEHHATWAATRRALSDTDPAPIDAPSCGRTGSDDAGTGTLSIRTLRVQPH